MQKPKKSAMLPAQIFCSYTQLDTRSGINTQPSMHEYSTNVYSKVCKCFHSLLNISVQLSNKTIQFQCTPFNPLHPKMRNKGPV